MENSALTNEELKETLNRIIGFISNSDSKVSYLLSTFGVIFTILLTLKFPNLNFINGMLSTSPMSCFGLAMIAIMCISLISFLAGLYHLTRVLFARVECNSYAPSKIFFGHISTYSPNYQYYLSSINNVTEEEYRKDLASQVYTNSVICDQKFKHYNKGFKLSVYSLPTLIITWSYLFQP